MKHVGDDILHSIISMKYTLSAARHSSMDRTLGKGIFQAGGIQGQPAQKLSQTGNTHNWTRNPTKAIGAGLPWSTLGTNGPSLPRRSFQASFPLDEEAGWMSLC